MEYKLLPRVPGPFAVRARVRRAAAASRCRREVLDVKVKPPTRSMHRFDIEVDGHAQLLRRRRHGAQQPRDDHRWPGAEVLRLGPPRRPADRDPEGRLGRRSATRTRVKVVKNKVSPPFKQAEFDILYGIGISREGGLIDMGVEQGIVRKSGAWYTYEGDQLGQGKENARAFLRDNPDLADEIEKRIKEKLGVGPRSRHPGRPTPASTSEVPHALDRSGRRWSRSTRAAAGRPVPPAVSTAPSPARPPTSRPTPNPRPSPAPSRCAS